MGGACSLVDIFRTMNLVGLGKETLWAGRVLTVAYHAPSSSVPRLLR